MRAEVLVVYARLRELWIRAQYWWYLNVMKLERAEDMPKSLPHGVKLRVEEGVGVYVIPRTHLDDRGLF